MQYLDVRNIGRLYIKWQTFKWTLVLNMDVSIVDEVNRQLSLPHI